MVILALVSSTPYVIVIYISLSYKFDFLGYLKDENMGITDITTIAIYHIVQWITLILYWFGINKFADTTSKIASKSVEIGKKCAGSSIYPQFTILYFLDSKKI